MDEVVLEETGEGPDYECGWCKGAGMIEINGPLHQIMKANKVARSFRMQDIESFEELARLAYTIWRGENIKAPHWDSLPEQWRDYLVSVYFLGQLDKQEAMQATNSQSSL